LKKCSGTKKTERRIALRIKRNKTSHPSKIALPTGLFSKKSYSNRSASNLKIGKSTSQKKIKNLNVSSGFLNNTRGR
jgi:hypothetical protein